MSLFAQTVALKSSSIDLIKCHHPTCLSLRKSHMLGKTDYFLQGSPHRDATGER